MVLKTPDGVTNSLRFSNNLPEFRFFQSFRYLRTTPCIMKAEADLAQAKTPTEIPKPSGPTLGPSGSGKIGMIRGAPTALDKRFLVWSGRFKSYEEIPQIVDEHVIHKARSWGRIRTNIFFLFVAAAGAVVMIYSGKAAAARGDNLEKRNLEWHRKIKEDYEKEKANSSK